MDIRCYITPSAIPAQCLTPEDVSSLAKAGITATPVRNTYFLECEDGIPSASEEEVLQVFRNIVLRSLGAVPHVSLEACNPDGPGGYALFACANDTHRVNTTEWLRERAGKA